MMRYFFFLLSLCCALEIKAQDDPPMVEMRFEDRQEAEFLKDSLRNHGTRQWQYIPHRCRNRQGKYGLVGPGHQVLIPFEYDDLPAKIAPFMEARKGADWGIINDQNRIILPLKFYFAHLSRDQKRIYAKGKKYREGVFDLTGAVLLPEAYGQITDLDGGKFCAYHVDQIKTMVFDTNCKVLYTTDYSSIHLKSSGRYQVSKITGMGSMLGLTDQQMNVLIPLDYTYIAWEEGDWAFVINHKTRARGLYQIAAKKFIPLDYYTVYPPDKLGNFVFLKEAGNETRNWGLMDPDFKIIIPAIYKQLGLIPGSDKYFFQTTKDHWGIGDQKGRLEMDTIYGAFSKYSFVTNRTMLENGQYEYIRDTSAFNLISIGNISPKYGLWHDTFGLIAPVIYDRIQLVDKQVFITGQHNEYVLRNARGDSLTAGYIQMNTMGYGKILARKANYPVVELDRQGREIRTLPDFPVDFYNPLFSIREGSKRALFSYDFQQITPFEYTNLGDFDGLPDAAYHWYQNNKTYPGYDKWRLWGQKEDKGPYFIIDQKGKALLIPQ